MDTEPLSAELTLPQSEAAHRRRPHVMACLRNLAIGALCRAGPVNFAARRTPPRPRPARSLATLGIIPG